MTLALTETESQRPPWLGEARGGWDHVRIHMQVLQDPRLGAFEQAIYLGIAAHAALSTGSAWPSKETLAEYAKVSHRTVYAAVRKLQATGYIEIVRSRGKANRYRLLPPPAVNLQLDLTVTQARGAALDSDPGTWCLSDRHVVPTNKNHEQEPSRPLAPAVLSRDSRAAQREEILQAFIRGSGLEPGTTTERARWLTGAEQLRRCQQANPVAVQEAARRQKEQWGDKYPRHPGSLASHWSRFYRKPSGPVGFRALIADHEPWMDFARLPDEPSRPTVIPAEA